MRHRSLGKTGLVVSELALGTWGLSGDAYGPVPETEQDAVIERARAFGIELFETADSYALGDMERRLGKLLGPDRAALFVTKIGTDRHSRPPRKRFDADYLGKAFDESRRRLCRDVVDVVLLHNPSVGALRRGEATGVLEELRVRGSLVAWGVSAGSAEVADAAIVAGAQVLEAAHHVLSSQIMSSIAERLTERTVGVLARSVLAHGLLCGHWPPTKEFGPEDHRSERWSSHELGRRLRQLDAVRPVLGESVQTLRAAALRFVLANEGVSSAVLGPRSRLQLDQLVREAGRKPPYLSTEQLRELEQRLRDAGAR
jgi:aryl-alcohol dehydrogenase-like predicted oxidoreductase